jgi:hypothetical protein
MIFVLHASADKARGEELAAVLAPAPVFPTCVGAEGVSRVQFGAGSLCVLVWSSSVTREVAAAMLNAVSNAWSQTVICRFGEGSAPMMFGGAPVIDMRQAGAGRALTDALQGLVDNGEGRRGPSPKLSAPAVAVKGNSSNFAVRSTYGLAATLAVVGVIAPSIIERAQATPSPADETSSVPLSPLLADTVSTIAVVPEAAEIAPLEPSHYERLGRLLTASIEPVAFSVQDERLAQFDRAESAHADAEDYAIGSSGFMNADLLGAKPVTSVDVASGGMFVLASDRGKVLSALNPREVALLATVAEGQGE